MRFYVMGIMAGLGIASVVFGMAGDRAYLIPGVLLLTGALIADAIYASRRRK